MASVPGFVAATKVSLLSNRCVAFTILFVRPNARLLQKELGKKLQLSFFNKFYYLLFLDRELTLSFCCFYCYLSFTYSCLPLLFLLLYRFWFVDCCFFCFSSFLLLSSSFPPFLVFLVLFDVCFDRLNNSQLNKSPAQ